MPRPFLTARWEHLVFMNFRCPPELLRPHVPAGTALDEWQGETFISVVGFMFCNTRLRGLPIPCHRTFEEVNLRYYIRRETPAGEVRRAVAFLRELVPRRAVALVARRVYNEPYLAVPMSHGTRLTSPDSGAIAYSWVFQKQPFGLRAAIDGPAADAPAGSQAEYITEHYWAYTRQRDGGTLEYKVEHPRWPIWAAKDWALEGPLESLYGEAFARVLRTPPASVFVAAGSAVQVYPGVRI